MVSLISCPSLRNYVSALFLGVFLSLVSGAQAQKAGEEITYPNKEFSKLDTFEGLNLQDADKLYAKKDYKGAYAAYKAYSFEFAKSKALPYVLLRMGRCLHQLEKRNAAIKSYQDVIDYFPDAVRYSAAAMYYIGQCHGQNGDDAKQTAVWAKMVKDNDYVNQPNSGTALTHLGSAMAKLKKYDEATEYHWRTAVNFLQSNPKAAADARKSVIYHYALRKPSHEKLSEFYIAASGFDGRGVKVKDAAENASYWLTAFNTALSPKESTETKKQACKYWVGKLGGLHDSHDDLRKYWCDAQMIYEGDRPKWISRLEAQFAKKTVDVNRLMEWCNYYKVVPDYRAKFFAKHSPQLLSGMKFPELMNFMSRLRHPLQMHDEAQQVMRTVRLDGLSDEQIKSYADFVGNYETEETVLKYYAKIKDKLYGAKARFDYYSSRSHRNKPYMEKALAEIPALQKSPKYADGLSWRKAELLNGLGQYEEAIKAYRAANQQPQSTWGVANCLVALKRYPEAVKNVKELELVGGDVASQAAFKVADIYRIAGDKGKEVNQLRLVMTRYPKSKESSEAHTRLESYGVALKGGESEAID